MAKASKAKKPTTTAGAASKRFEAALRQVEETANASDSDSGDSFLDDDEGEREAEISDDDDESGSVDEFGMLKFEGEEKGEVDEADSGDEFAGFDDDGSSHEQTKSDASDEEEEEGQAGYDSDSDNENGDLMNLKQALTQAAERAAAEKAEQERKIRKRKLYGDWADNAPPPLSDEEEEEEEEEDGKPREKKKKVTLEDIRAHTSSAFGTRAIARLDELEKRAKGKSEVVKARLGRRIEQRVDRAAAYEIAKTEISKWDETVQQNRRAETLEFPLQQNRSSAAGDNVAQGLDDDAEFAGETLVHQLEGRQVSLEEVRARRNEMRRMREMMFREEMKARRVKKIKSKTYRKVHKRERERDAQVAAQLNGEDEDVDDDDEGYDKLVARARERMQLKHKNTSKWARDMKRMSLNKDKSNRAELEEMLRRGEELTQKVAGSDDDSSGDELPDDNDDADEAETSPGSKKVKGIMQMKFMKDAEDRIRKSNREEIAAIRRMQDDDDDAEELEDQGDTAREVINEGRRRYGPGALEAQAEAQAAVDKSNEMEEDDRPSSIIKKRGRNIEIRHVQDDGDDAPQQKKGGKTGGKKASAEDAANPWIQDVDPGSVTKGGSLRAVDKDSSRSEKTEAKLKRARQRSAKAAAAAGDPAEGDVQINVNEILKVRGVHDDADEDDDDGEVPDAAVTMVAKNGRTEFQQKELVKRAFAGDDVVREFEEEKKHVVEDEGDKEIDVTLPGWGSWTGMGTRKSGKRFIEKVDGIKIKDRKDHRLQNVIINEKSIKKSAKYLTEKVPYPYETRAQYERAMRMPIGKEWVTQSTLQEATKPRVIVKPGVVIDPLTAPFS